MPSPRELATQKRQLRKQQEKLLKDLLPVLDNLDHACDHWQKAQTAQVVVEPTEVKPTEAVVETSKETFKQDEVNRASSGESSGWQQLWQQFTGLFRASPAVESESSSVSSASEAVATPSTSPSSEQAAIEELVNSAADGVTMIRQSMLETLKRHQVVPLGAVGKPFDPEQMYALGQQVNNAVPPNTVIQEVVRGYLWQDRVLREAQVIVAVPDNEA